jgi:hypothetical protein
MAQKGDEMYWTLRALGPAVGLFVAVSPGLALAQADNAVSGLTETPSDKMTWPEKTWPETTWPETTRPAGAAATTGTLPPAEILAEVRREGFYPVGRPVRRGRVYVLFAVDQDDFDVQLTVDAASGRVLRVAGAIARFGGPGQYGYRSIWRERPPVPPADTPDARNGPGPAGTRHVSLKRFPPLPRKRPVPLAGDPVTDTSPPPAPPVTMVPEVNP